MALDKTTLQTSIEDAFKKDKWTDCASAMATAIDTYIKGGKITASGTATVVIISPPSSTPTPYSMVAAGTISTAGTTTLEGSLNIAFQATSWTGVGNQVGTAISTQLTTSTISITPLTGGYVPPFVGSSTKVTVVTAACIALLQSTLESSFSTGTDWVIVAAQIATAIDTFTKAAAVTTVDAGTAPPNSWTGTATGTIV